MNGYYDLIGYHPGADFFAGAIEMQPHPDGQGGQLWHITTPLGQLSPRALALSSNGFSQAEAQAAARAWDARNPYTPNPWLGETVAPALGQPHPLK